MKMIRPAAMNQYTALREAVLRILKIPAGDLLALHILRRSIDARAGTLDPQERAVLTTGLTKLKTFFEESATTLPSAQKTTR